MDQLPAFNWTIFGLRIRAYRDTFFFFVSITLTIFLNILQMKSGNKEWDYRLYFLSGLLVIMCIIFIYRMIINSMLHQHEE